MGFLGDLGQRLLHKLLRKKQRHSIEGAKGGKVWPKFVPLRPSHDETGVEDKGEPALTPSRARSIDYLRASTPIKTRGILVFEGETKDVEEGETEEVDEGGTSQAESCIEWDEWNEPQHDVPVDTSIEFMIDGGEESSSVYCEEEEEKTGEKGDEECSDVSDYLFDEEYEEDDFDGIAEQQAVYPVRQKEEEYFIHPTTRIADDEGYNWVEPVGYSAPRLAPSTPLHLAYPALSHYDKGVLASVARAVIEEDKNGMGRKKTKEWTPVGNTTYAVDKSVTPSRRPDTPTTNAETRTSSPTTLSDGDSSPIDSSSSGPSEVPTGPSDVSSAAKPTRPSCARDEENAWLRSLYEKSGLSHETPEWMMVDPPKKICNEESPAVGGQRGWVSSTPVFTMVSPVFSSISTIGRFNESSLSATSQDGSRLGTTFTLDVGVRARAALARPSQDFLITIFGIED